MASLLACIMLKVNFLLVLLGSLALVIHNLLCSGYAFFLSITPKEAMTVTLCKPCTADCCLIYAFILQMNRLGL